MTNHEYRVLQFDLQQAHNHLKAMEAMITTQAEALRQVRNEGRMLFGEKLWNAATEATNVNYRLHTSSMMLRLALEGVSRTAERSQDVLEQEGEQ